jgi:hypothetical protein
MGQMPSISPNPNPIGHQQTIITGAEHFVRSECPFGIGEEAIEGVKHSMLKEN